ncbi:MAG TPA: hypothetical protein PLM14_02320 [Candidatus Hydrogenedentes bacterium]|nr:hypothetical protein [Candidatus Hydrogenedentota bacterium]HQE81804.1 hypothetical protein [Candidatus Hydrogenedentota bacterium]HQH51619.1 hypothetical protein [Candidatus Hydrogenedentota bacterium]HQM49970.1 hypothetical protein [Candidatus Hydrogenedentota bacterium]
MGVEVQTLRLLLLAKRAGVGFNATISLGHQDILVTSNRLRDVFAAFDMQISEAEAVLMTTSSNRFCDELFARLGATQIDSVDASGFEEATILHDLNQPFPSHLVNRYSLAFDGGTLEHVFDLPRALRNFMELPSIGGHIIMVSPANNHMGHGFYQFSPELFYRVFSEENGYRLRALYLARLFSDSDWFRVMDPAIVQSRVGYNSTLSAFSLLAIARRVSLAPIFKNPPQQSDYVSEWKNRPNKTETGNRLSFFERAVNQETRQTHGFAKVKSLIKKAVPHRTKERLRAWRAWAEPNPKHFERCFSLAAEQRRLEHEGTE